jgi:hypothetical protein
MDERIDKIINKFYTNNNIISSNYTDSMKDAYHNNKYFDMRIAYSTLRDKINNWIQGFEPEDRETFLEMLEKFTYLTQEALSYRIYCICEEIFNQLNLVGIEKKDLIFVVVESSNGVKSGADEITVKLWDACRPYELEKSQIITAYSKTSIENIEKSKVIIFIDDILATGFTMKKQIDDFYQRFSSICDNSKKYYFTGVFVTKNAIKYIKRNLKHIPIDFESFYQDEQVIKSAFKGNYIFHENKVKEMEQKVREYEKFINEYKKEYNKDFTMGFRQCKLLLAFHYETPNNTLCSFWRGTNINYPIFERSGNSGLTVKDLKIRKRHMSENSYFYKSLNRGDNL